MHLENNSKSTVKYTLITLELAVVNVRQESHLNEFIITLLILPVTITVLFLVCSPTDWHKGYPKCGGRAQSPIDIRTKRSTYQYGRLRQTFNQNLLQGELENNGHAPTFKIDKSKGKIRTRTHTLHSQPH